MTDIELKRNELVGYLLYLQLMGGLDPDPVANISNPRMKQTLIKIFDFVKKSSDYEFTIRYKQIKKLLRKYTSGYLKHFPPKKSMEEIAFQYGNITAGKPDFYSYGIEYGWLETLMDCKKMNLPSCLPYQAKVGIFHHAGNVSTEDQFLLTDAFYILAKAISSYKLHLKYGEYLNKKLNNKINKEAYREITDNKLNSITYARLSLVGFYSFIEAFVNSIGYDYYKWNESNLDETTNSILKGIKNNRFISIEDKFEKFPQIIRNDQLQKVFVKDAKQRKDPYLTFLDKYKKLRDSSVHHSPDKENIWLKPEDWKNKAVEFSKITMAVAKDFWHSCYPDKELPGYLDGLDYDELLKIAERRISTEFNCIEKTS